MTKHDQMLAMVERHKELTLKVAAGYAYPPDYADQLADALTALLVRTAKAEAERDYNRRDAEHLRNVVDRLNGWTPPAKPSRKETRHDESA